MSFCTTPSAEPEQYSVVLSSSTYADSFSDALSMFFAQMAGGNISVEIHNADTDTSEDLNDLADENFEDQENLALMILARRAKMLSNHRKLELVNRVQVALGLNTTG